MSFGNDVSVRLLNVTKRYKAGVAVDDLTLDIGAGEFFSILGPSGCGKTTTLRMLGGFLYPETGDILIDGVDVTTTPPYRRNVNTVFQTYALFEHLSVFDNVAFGLRRRKLARALVRRRVDDALEQVRLAEFAARKPSALSGGQRQRVALARALVNLPSVLLLDEPLAALDLQLRRQMQTELRRIHREVGVTFVFVTHDQEEAMSMSDRVAVMKDGVLQQVGSPLEIYDRPTTDFVAGFIGASNLIPGTGDGSGFVALGRQRLPCRSHGVANSAPAVLSVRPEHLQLVNPASGHIDARVVDSTFLGSVIQVALQLPDGSRVSAAVPRSRVADDGIPDIGAQAGLTWHPDHALVLARTEATGVAVGVQAAESAMSSTRPSDEVLEVRS